jgi:uncharacterized protein (DUF433 family)
MSLTIINDPVPLAADADNVFRVGGTRVSLDTVVHAFKEGATAEEIVQDYPTLKLADVYAVIGYYLQHTFEVEAYLRERHQQRMQIRQQNENFFDPEGVRERLLAQYEKQMASGA